MADVIDALKKIATEVFSDDSTAKLAEKYQKKYGTLTEEDLDVVYF